MVHFPPPNLTPLPPLEQRRQEALAIAQQCEQILKQQFGATQVILFGSLAGDAPWHWQSDLDLAVSGLSHADWLQAYGKLETILPPWLSLDLIRLETVDSPVSARILKETPMSANPYLALKQHLEDELTALERSSQSLQMALERAKPHPDDYDVRALASYINDVYRRCERMSERVAIALDGGLPQGKNWHQALLRQVADARSDRPPLWSGSLLFDLDEYRKFRHVVHHKYGDELQADYVIALAELAPAMVTRIQAAIAQFSQWLMQQAPPDTSK